jgi:8-oxo-dGTP pyrophosphatase MutT (NUDIX family)
VRAVILTPANEVLLIRIANPASSWTGWITPGGGIDAGETEEQALYRELREELGLETFEIGPRIWKRFDRFPWNGKVIEQSEAFYLLRLPRFEPKTEGMTETEMLDVRGLRWWKVDEVRASQELFAPRPLGSLLQNLAEGRVPAQATDVPV